MHDIPGLALKATSSIRALLKKRFESLYYKGSQIKVAKPASHDEIENMKRCLSTVLTDENFANLSSISKAVVLNDDKFKLFMDKHLRLTSYSITVKKCTDTNCEFHSHVQVPANVFKDLHYLPAPILQSSEKYFDFNDLYGQEPNEKDRPSLQQIRKEKTVNKADFQLQVSKARIIVKCRECGFPRLLYSRKKLDTKEELEIRDYLSCNMYICGTEVPGMFQAKYYACYDPISPHYFQLADKLKGYERLCTYCLAKDPQEVKRKNLVCKSCFSK